MGKIKTFIIIVQLVIIALLLTWIVNLKNEKLSGTRDEIVHTLIVNDMKDILKLAVMEFNVSDIVENRIENYVNILSFPLYVGEKEMDLLVRGKMTVGFDLEKVGSDSFLLNHGAKTIDVTLPAPELIAMDTDYKFLNETKTLWLQIEDKERNRLMAMAKARLYDIARAKRIMDKAEFAGVERITGYLNELYPGYQVTIVVAAVETE